MIGYLWSHTSVLTTNPPPERSGSIRPNFWICRLLQKFKSRFNPICFWTHSNIAINIQEYQLAENLLEKPMWNLFLQESFAGKSWHVVLLQVSYKNKDVKGRGCAPTYCFSCVALVDLFSVAMILKYSDPKWLWKKKYVINNFWGRMKTWKGGHLWKPDQGATNM